MRRDPLDRLIVRVPGLARALSAVVRRVPVGSPARRRLLQTLVKRGFAAMARSDVDLVVLNYEPDAVVEMHGMAAVGVGERYSGHDGVRALYADIDSVFSDWRWDIAAIVDRGDALAVRADFIGYGQASGAETALKDAGTALRLSERGLVAWQGWYVEQGGWESARAALRRM